MKHRRKFLEPLLEKVLKKCSQLLKSLWLLQSEKQNAAVKLAELQKNHVWHLKYVVRKLEEQALSRKSEETGQQSLEDICSFFAEKS